MARNWRACPIENSARAIVVSVPRDLTEDTVFDWMQAMADHEAEPVFTIFNAVPCMAVPGGDVKALIRSYHRQGLGKAVMNWLIPAFDEWATSRKD